MYKTFHVIWYEKPHQLQINFFSWVQGSLPTPTKTISTASLTLLYQPHTTHQPPPLAPNPILPHLISNQNIFTTSPHLLDPPKRQDPPFQGIRSIASLISSIHPSACFVCQLVSQTKQDKVSEFAKGRVGGEISVRCGGSKCCLVILLQMMVLLLVETEMGIWAWGVGV